MGGNYEFDYAFPPTHVYYIRHLHLKLSNSVSPYLSPYLSHYLSPYISPYFSLCLLISPCASLFLPIPLFIYYFIFFALRTKNLTLLSHYALIMLFIGVVHSLTSGAGYALVNCTVVCEEREERRGEESE